MTGADARSAPPPMRQRIFDEAERLIAVKGVHTLLLRRPTAAEVREGERWLRDIAVRHLAPRRAV